MVRGLDVFRKHFANHADQFVLIGGTAATLAMENEGLLFRATKDLDIVLHIEALNPAFGAAFWNFVELGGYEIRQASETGKPLLYRFQKPANPGFPAMLELFCRSPDGIQLAAGAHRPTADSTDEAAGSRAGHGAISADFIVARSVGVPRGTVGAVPLSLTAERL